MRPTFTRTSLALLVVGTCAFVAIAAGGTAVLALCLGLPSVGTFIAVVIHACLGSASE